MHHEVGGWGRKIRYEAVRFDTAGALGGASGKKGDPFHEKQALPRTARCGR